MDSIATQLLEIHHQQQILTTSPWSHDVIELAIATYASLAFSDLDRTALIWLLVAGAPSSDKTETILTLQDAFNVVHLDTLTENSFVSGYIDHKGKVAEDLLSILNRQCLLVKDMTTLFSLREDKVKHILGDLQSIYDGAFTRFTGTRGKVSHSAKFSMLAGITPAVLSKHHRYMSSIGGRFLIYRLPPLTETEREAGFDLSWGMKARAENVAVLRERVKDLCKKISEATPTIHEESLEIQRQINLLAELLARGRAVIDRQHQRYLDEERGTLVSTYEVESVQTEEPWRAFQQLRNLGRSLSLIHDRAIIGDHELELLRRIALSSMPVDRSQVLRLFVKCPEGLTVKACAEGIGKRNGRARQLLDELLAIELVQLDKSMPEHVYRLIPKLAPLIIKPIMALDHVEELCLSHSGEGTK